MSKQTVKVPAEAASVRETLALSSGVMVRVQAIPRDLWLEIMSRVAEPTPPVVLNEATGRYEENDSDPAYLQAKQRYVMDKLEAMTRGAYLFGVVVVSIPPDVLAPDSAEWHARRVLLRRTEPGAELLDWLRLVAAPSGADNAVIMREIGRATGTREADVQEALKSPRRAA